MIQLIRDPKIHDFIAELKCTYADHPDCRLFHMQNYINIPDQATHFGWSSDTLLITHKGNQVGYVGWEVDNCAKVVRQLGVFVVPKFQNKGIGIVTAVAVIHYLLFQKGFRKVVFSAIGENAKQYVRTGLEPVGILKEDVLTWGGKYADEYIFEVFPSTTKEPAFARYTNLCKRVSFY